MLLSKQFQALVVAIQHLVHCGFKNEPVGGPHSGTPSPNGSANPGISLRWCEGTALVLAAGNEVGRGVHPSDLPAFEDVSELLLAVVLPVGAGRELHVMLIHLIIDGLFALVV
jgi:hypothetical protein